MYWAHRTRSQSRSSGRSRRVSARSQSATGESSSGAVVLSRICAACAPSQGWSVGRGTVRGPQRPVHHNRSFEVHRTSWRSTPGCRAWSARMSSANHGGGVFSGADTTISVSGSCRRSPAATTPSALAGPSTRRCRISELDPHRAGVFPSWSGSRNDTYAPTCAAMSGRSRWGSPCTTRSGVAVPVSSLTTRSWRSPGDRYVRISSGEIAPPAFTRGVDRVATCGRSATRRCT